MMINPVEKIGEKKVTSILQNRQKLMIKELKKILQDNGITFYLACGTALGCIRHSGFIPWDDDVDIYIRGRDYKKLRELLTSTKKTSLEFQDYSTNVGYPYTFPKIVAKDTVLVEHSLNNIGYQCGVYIDVFPLFGITDNVIARFFREKYRYFLYSIIRAYYNESFTKGYRRILGSLTRKLFSPEKMQKRLERIYMKDAEGTEYLIDAGSFGKQAYIKRGSFDDIIYLPFENEPMPMPKGYSTYLKDYYGDYMVLPAEEDRVSKHIISSLKIAGIKELEE